MFRQKFVQMVYATTTLAQGIHMPCRTVVFAGDSIFLNSLNYQQAAGRAGRRGFDQDGHVIFFGIKSNKISRLLNANLPKILGNSPMNVSQILRLYTLVSASADTKDALSRVLCFMNNPLILQTSPKMGPHLKLFFVFASSLLFRLNLIDIEGSPIGFAGLISHIHYHEPFNLGGLHVL